MLRYHERLQACLDGYLGSDIPLTMACVALDVNYQDARAVLGGVSIDEIADPADADILLQQELCGHLTVECGLSQKEPLDCGVIPVHNPQAAPTAMRMADWAITGYTAAVQVGASITVGVQIPHAVEGWSIPSGAVIICADRLMPSCWLRLDKGWTIARTAPRGRWSDASGQGHYPRNIVKWWLGVVEVRYALPLADRAFLNCPQ